MSYSNACAVWARSNATSQVLNTTLVTLPVDRAVLGNTRYTSATKTINVANSICCADMTVTTSQTFGGHFHIAFQGGSTSYQQTARQVGGWGNAAATANDSCFTRGTSVSLRTDSSSTANCTLPSDKLLIIGVQI
jgi:hypothetical protein